MLANTGGMSMKALRWLFLLMFVLSTTLAAIMLLVQAPAHAQDGGRGGSPPQAVALSQEVANEDPQTATMRNDRMDFPPFKIIGNLYYVGTAFCGSYLMTTPMGNILINTNFEETVPFMKKNIESLGFKFEDTKIILASHGHPDHQTGDAMVKQMTGAMTEFMAEDIPAIKNIKPRDGKEHPIDKVLHDGDVVTLGGTTLTAHLNPGHTLGCTTWTLGHGCGTQIQRDDCLRRTPGQYPVGLQPGAAGNRPSVAIHHRQMEDLSHRCFPWRAHLVFQPNRQVQEDADQPEGTKRLDRSERVQEVHRRYAGTARQADCGADCSWPAGSERRRTRSSVAARPGLMFQS